MRCGHQCRTPRAGCATTREAPGFESRARRGRQDALDGRCRRHGSCASYGEKTQTIATRGQTSCRSHGLRSESAMRSRHIAHVLSHEHAATSVTDPDRGRPGEPLPAGRHRAPAGEEPRPPRTGWRRTTPVHRAPVTPPGRQVPEASPSPPGRARHLATTPLRVYDAPHGEAHAGRCADSPVRSGTVSDRSRRRLRGVALPARGESRFTCPLRLGGTRLRPRGL
jgi:hypothetical protein